MKLVFLSIRLCFNSCKDRPITMKLIFIGYYCGKFGIENEVYKIYGSFTEKLKRIPLCQELWGRDIRNHLGCALMTLCYFKHTEIYRDTTYYTTHFEQNLSLVYTRIHKRNWLKKK